MSRELRSLAFADEDTQWRVINSACPVDLLKFDANFEDWAHRNQLPPSGEGWRTWLMMAGRGFGKTRAGSEWVHSLASKRAGVRIALVGASMIEARAIMVEGVSGLLTVARGYGARLSWEPSLGRLRWANGSEAHLFSGESPDGLRGPEHEFAWCDELAKWPRADEAWMNLQMGLRRGPRPRALVTTTPRPLALLEQLREQPTTVTTTGRTTDNINLDDQFLAVMTATYGGTWIGRQELDGELLAERDGSLWPSELIARSRGTPPENGWTRILIGVDPPAGAGPGHDACGIVVVGEADGIAWVLADDSVRGLSPEGWARCVAASAARWGAQLVVAEANNGGAMVQSVLKVADSGLNVRLVHATKGKVARAEPVALRFEAGRARFGGRFAELEAELTGMVAGGDYCGPGRSPDRADAMVWAVTALNETRSGVPRVRRV